MELNKICNFMMQACYMTRGIDPTKESLEEQIKRPEKIMSFLKLVKNHRENK
jgi:hypothetical protein